MNIFEKSHSLRKIFLFLLLPILALACGISFPLVNMATPTFQPVPTAVQVEQEPVTLPAPVVDEQSTLIDLYQRVNPAVVNITIYGSQGGQVVALSQGSGFAYDNQGHVVTNAHVVQDAEQIDVTFSDGSIQSGQVLGVDLNSDLAVLKVDQMPSGVQPLPLGDMDTLEVGESVVAIGNPFGLEGTLTRGIISALGRTIPALTPFSIPQAIQTDASINPGNSGGPLLNLQGQVIGVNAQIETSGLNTSNSGVGFAIPVNILKRVVPDLVENGQTEWSWLGIRGGSLQPTQVEAMKLPVDRGAFISEITPGGPAEKAGLQGSNDTTTVNGRATLIGGDVITAIEDQPVRSFDDLLIYIALETRPGQEISLTIIRGGKTQEVNVQMAPRPETLDTQTIP